MVTDSHYLFPSDLKASSGNNMLETFTKDDKEVRIDIEIDLPSLLLEQQKETQYNYDE